MRVFIASTGNSLKKKTQQTGSLVEARDPPQIAPFHVQAKPRDPQGTQLSRHPELGHCH